MVNFLAIANIWFSGKKYTYEFKKPERNTDSDIALAISQAMWEKQHKRKLTKFSGAPQHYNLLMELMSRKRIVHTSSKGEIDYFAEATRRTNEEKHIFDENTQTWKVLVWRVGKTFSNRVTIEIDNSSIENLIEVSKFYENVLKLKFRAFKTNKGFWLISDKIPKEQFVFLNCKVLNPELTLMGLKSFIDLLCSADYDKDGNFLKASPEAILKLPGVKPFGDIDILFTLLSIKREQSTLRISKKHKNDRIEEVII